jgi:hypothetical protein
MIFGRKFWLTARFARDAESAEENAEFEIRFFE